MLARGSQNGQHRRAILAAAEASRERCGRSAGAGDQSPAAASVHRWAQSKLHVFHGSTAAMPAFMHAVMLLVCRMHATACCMHKCRLSGS
jgi:hypothetical protein